MIQKQANGKEWLMSLVWLFGLLAIMFSPIVNILSGRLLQILFLGWLVGIPIGYFVFDKVRQWRSR